jgi:hypothetical protein
LLVDPHSPTNAEVEGVAANIVEGARGGAIITPSTSIFIFGRSY